MKSTCGHIIPSEKRSSRMPRFLAGDESLTLEEALERPLVMDKMPFEVNPTSPTPLDPYNLKVHGGLSYATAAKTYMTGRLHDTAGVLADSHPKIVDLAEYEIDMQHRHRMEKNNEAMSNWRELAATDASTKILTHNEAEGIMQVRAGIAYPSAIAELLARNPSMGGIELAKATRPFCFSAFDLAKRSLYGAVKVLNARPGFSVDLDSGVHPRPYKSNIDQNSMSLMTKSKLGTISVRGVEMEVISRESGILYHPEQTESIPEAVSINFGPHRVESVLVDTTSYLRVKQ